eukprot:TRINITY_DN1505_c0_g1_i3.p1 TRINITY_DN1505_c0_g1~~TRINITY_DN1505_c0_g1_i3.p1  ORF type:complete len:492 (-),score=55.80 TRINITY_DN1505_c0_g1_i3:549-2024(-)
MKYALVTGGLGCLGHVIVELLLQKGVKVRVVDVVNNELFEGDARVDKVIGSICDPNLMDLVIRDIDTVFHCAAIVNLHYWAPPIVREVNVGGCQALIDACERSHAAGTLSVKSIIYTSSHGVVFNGQPIDMGDETLPYATRFVDEYTKTKLEGEKLMRAFSGRCGVLTCAFRPGGIYGPRDMFTTMRLLRVKQLHLDAMVNSSCRLDMTFTYDMAKAQILAVEKLEKERVTPGPVAGGVYHIGTPALLWGLLDGIAIQLGFPKSKIAVPALPMVWVAWGMEFLHFFLRPVVDLRSKFYFMMCPIEMVKLANPHTFSNEKARRELGYTPFATEEESMKITADWLRSVMLQDEQIRARWNVVDIPSPRVFPAITAAIIVGASALYLAAFADSSTTNHLFSAAPILQSFFDLLHSTRGVWVFVWYYVLVLLHTLEAIYAIVAWLWRDDLRKVVSVRSLLWVILILCFGGAALVPLMQDSSAAYTRVRQAEKKKK